MYSLQFVRQGLEEQITSPFLQQGPLENLADIMPVITAVSKNLIVGGLNIHNYNILLLSEALTFYEEVCIYSKVYLYLIYSPYILFL